MPSLPQELYTPDQVRDLDRLAIEVGGVAGERLMERAGRRAWAVLRRRWPAARRIVVVCGGGNNGGDGYVAAYWAARAGCRVDLLYLVEPQSLRGDAATHAQRYLDAGGRCRPFDPAPLAEADVVVDAVLGTGLDRPVAGRFAAAVAALNAAAAPVLALDIPSGLHGRTGAVMGDAVHAVATVTFVGLKSGLMTGRGPRCAGAVYFDDLGVGSLLAGRLTPYAWLTTGADLRAALPPRHADAHKGDFGHVLVVGGEHGMAGAARLAAEAAARSGAGRVSVATRAEHVAALVGGRPELMVHAVRSGEELAPLLARASVIAVGPGLGGNAWGVSLWEACRRAPQPKVVDADALNLLAAAHEPVTQAVLTPHPGEAARVLATTTAALAEDRFAATRRLLARAPGGVAVLKGAGTVVDDGVVRSVAAVGNPAMAAGGMGDVLTGVIAGLIAQGLPLASAARCGVWAHGAAGDAAAARLGERGLLAGDLMAELPRVLSA